MQSEGPITAAKLCRSESARKFWERYFQTARFVSWDEFLEAYEAEFGKLRLEHSHLIRRRLDEDGNHVISVNEFAMVTNALGVPDTFKQLVSIVEDRACRSIALRFHNQTPLEHLAASISSDVVRDRCSCFPPLPPHTLTFQSHCPALRLI